MTAAAASRTGNPRARTCTSAPPRSMKTCSRSNRVPAASSDQAASRTGAGHGPVPFRRGGGLPTARDARGCGAVPSMSDARATLGSA